MYSGSTLASYFNKFNLLDEKLDFFSKSKFWGSSQYVKLTYSTDDLGDRIAVNPVG